MPTSKIKLLISRVGDGFSQTPGMEIEVDEGEAFRMVEAGQAVFLSEAPVTTEQPETDSQAPATTKAGSKGTKTTKKTPTASADQAPVTTEEPKA